ncbi:hypothetical protein LDDCCGHA_0818 [Methylobacterium oxalidis]|nr:hypothetical protein LDDCCGHA_0818 [Methylobacterium oxalidis]
MDEGRVALQGLHEVGLQRVLEEHGHRARGLHVLEGDELAVAGLGDDDAAEALLEILEVLGEAEHRHHLGGHRDVEAVLAREAVGDAAERLVDGAQRPVVHVDHAAPEDAPHVDVELVRPVDVVVDQRGGQRVRRGDGVEVAGEVQVDLLHRHDLRLAAARSTPLHAEAGAERGLAQADHGLLADAVQRVAEADRRRRLAFAGRRRADRGHEDELALGPALQARDVAVVDLGDVLAVIVERVLRDAELLGDLGDRLQGRRAGDLDV